MAVKPPKLLGFEWPLLGGGQFKAQLIGHWTKVDVENLKVLLEKIVQIADLTAAPDRGDDFETEVDLAE